MTLPSAFMLHQEKMDYAAVKHKIKATVTYSFKDVQSAHKIGLSQTSDWYSTHSAYSGSQINKAASIMNM